MKLANMVGRRIRETPRDATTNSHIFLLRGGYIRPVSAGIYSILPLGKRIITKIERIIREEMDKVGGQEVLMPVVLPREIWDESGRYETVGGELLRFKDRNDKDMLLGMTHEEAVVHLTRTEVNSYKQLPCMLYQIQTKYRDEARPRAGLIRVREFTMKDAYSFHASMDSLSEYYDEVHEAYVRIYKRLGMQNVISVESDSGMMGGAVSHEFMAIADCGEDTIFVSSDGDYTANKEIALANIDFEKEEELPLEKVHTPNKKTILEVSEFLDQKPENTGKAVFYSDSNGALYFVEIRGDFEVNEAKLKKVIGRADIDFATDEQIKSIGSVPGYASTLNLDLAKCRVIFDKSAVLSSNLTVGANEVDYHYKNFNFNRDIDISKVEVADIATVRAGDPSPRTGSPLEAKRGIEVGNIFQLGTKYTESMNCKFLDKNGKSQNMIMGCYGIGVGRSMAAVIEGSCDKFGPIWPISISPYHIHICVLNANKENVAEIANSLYQELLDKGFEVLIDDRKEKAGVMFNDADLIGIPHRIIISPKNLQNNQVEYKRRGSRDAILFDLSSASKEIGEIVKKDMEEFNL